MNAKKAKKLRKEMRKKSEELITEEMRRLTEEIPVAGCPNCTKEFWVLELDNYPPEHTKIVRYICANPICGQAVIADHNIEPDPDEVIRKAVERDGKVQRRVPVEDLCQECGFEVDDCQCESEPEEERPLTDGDFGT